MTYISSCLLAMTMYALRPARGGQHAAVSVDRVRSMTFWHDRVCATAVVLWVYNEQGAGRVGLTGAGLGGDERAGRVSSEA